MLEVWIPITCSAAFLQNLRSALQKHLKERLSNTGAAYARFLCALPFVVAYIFLLMKLGGQNLPDANPAFLFYCLLGSVAQILFTTLLLWMFSFQSFAVGTTFSKLEVITVAVFGALVLGDTLTANAVVAIIITSFGIVALSSGQTGLTIQTLLNRIGSKETLIGLACSLFLGASVVFFRGASLALHHEDPLMAAAFTLLTALLMQTVLMGAWLIIREPGQLKKVCTTWRWTSLVGATGALASIGWFTAFTLQNASYVRALGQIELIFTFLFSTLIFKEKVSRIETAGILLVAIGILTLLLPG